MMAKLNQNSISQSALKLAQACIAIGMTTMLLSACVANPTSLGPTDLRNKITVAETIERMELYPQQNGLQLSARDTDAMGGFLSTYRQVGEGPLYVNMPTGPAYQTARMALSHRDIMQSLGALGIASSQVQTGQYAGANSGVAPIVVSYRRLSATPIKCQIGADVLFTHNNQPYNNFGCAQTANLAAMIDNPRQFLSPYDLASADTNRRQLVLENYAQGSGTATPRPAGQEINAGGN